MVYNLSVFIVKIFVIAGRLNIDETVKSQNCDVKEKSSSSRRVNLEE